MRFKDFFRFVSFFSDYDRNALVTGPWRKLAEEWAKKEVAYEKVILWGEKVAELQKAKLLASNIWRILLAPNDTLGSGQ